MSRQKQLESAAELVGNAAAHIVLYKDQTGIRETLEYMGQAQVRIAAKNWNDKEMVKFRELAQRRAEQEIKERTGKSRGKKHDQAVTEATSLIEQFIEQRMQ